MGLLPTYNHIINPKLKNIYLSFNNRGELVIKSPKIPIERIEKLLISKASWIEKTRRRLAQRKGQLLDFNEQSVLFYMGNSYPLVLKDNHKTTELSWDGYQFTLSYKIYDEAVFRRKIDQFYLKKAQELLPSIVYGWANKMQLVPSDIKFRKTISQWGSCTGKNTLSFNTMMMKLPQHLVEYIIIHELCHISHKHHQKSFWNMVETFMPNYKSSRIELKSYA
ncbi:MAG: SprT family zinc-dependent metalloprotease [Sulfurovaceae bacterium]|nr:SprT family zinc-dependent metalloprotease [Sulfurovaceae bacterium]